ncbi:MAG: TIGR02221 family CRISPR-associated protein [Caldilinea sp.]|nr:TIGR02221 family CRISPR-associated protein [Caldilinea sp.]
MKAISFLGTTKYKMTTYVYRDKEMTTRLFAEALPTFFPDIEQVVVFVTPTVERDDHGNLKDLSEHLGDLFKPVRIPEGHDEKDLWAIFTALTEAVEEGEEVVFDITNSFRSLPFLVFLAAAYLRTARSVNVVGVLYGAFEAGGENQRSPVFDLTPFVSLLDWLTATDQFIQTGDARQLAKLLNPSQVRKGPSADASNALSTVSLAAFLCQPYRLMSEAQQLDARLQAAEEVFPDLPRPYQMLRDRIVDTFGAFGADSDGEPEASLVAQMRLIEWYYANNQLIQAVTLAREWLISAITYRLGLPIDLKPGARRTMERAISGVSRVGRQYRDEETDEKLVFMVEDLNQFGRQIYDTWPERDTLSHTWDNLSAVRNALDHAGHQVGAMKLENVTKKVDGEIMPGLRLLAQAWFGVVANP